MQLQLLSFDSELLVLKVLELVLAEGGDKLNKVKVLLLCSFSGKAELSRNAWQVHSDPIALEPVVLALRRFEEMSSLIVSIPLY